MGMTSSNGERLAEASKLRRDALRITQPAAAEAGRVGVSTLRQVETATQPGGLSRRTLLGLDRGLRWAPGSAERLLSGDASAPEPLDTNGWPTTNGDWAAYVAKREQEADDAAAVREGSLVATEAFEKVRDSGEPARLISEFSDAELIAEVARRIAEARRHVMPPADAQA